METKINNSSNIQLIKDLITCMEIDVDDNGYLYHNMMRLNNKGRTNKPLRFFEDSNRETDKYSIFDPITKYKHAKFILDIFLSENDDKVNEFDYQEIDNDGIKTYTCRLLDSKFNVITEVTDCENLKIGIIKIIIKYFDEVYDELDTDDEY